MTRIFLATATALTLAAASPAAAISLTVDFPTLNFPPKPAPETTKNCTAPTQTSTGTCSLAAK